MHRRGNEPRLGERIFSIGYTPLTLSLFPLSYRLELNSKKCVDGQYPVSTYQYLHFRVLFTVKYTRDPATFYAAKLQKALADGDTDTARRVILTSTTVELLLSLLSFRFIDTEGN